MTDWYRWYSWYRLGGVIRPALFPPMIHVFTLARRQKKLDSQYGGGQRHIFSDSNMMSHTHCPSKQKVDFTKIYGKNSCLILNWIKMWNSMRQQWETLSSVKTIRIIINAESPCGSEVMKKRQMQHNFCSLCKHWIMFQIPALLSQGPEWLLLLFWFPTKRLLRSPPHVDGCEIDVNGFAYLTIYKFT